MTPYQEELIKRLISSCAVAVLCLEEMGRGHYDFSIQLREAVLAAAQEFGQRTFSLGEGEQL